MWAHAWRCGHLVLRTPRWPLRLLQRRRRRWAHLLRRRQRRRWWHLPLRRKRPHLWGRNRRHLHRQRRWPHLLLRYPWARGLLHRLLGRWGRWQAVLLRRWQAVLLRRRRRPLLSRALEPARAARSSWRRSLCRRLCRRADDEIRRPGARLNGSSRCGDGGPLAHCSTAHATCAAAAAAAAATTAAAAAAAAATTAAAAIAAAAATVVTVQPSLGLLHSLGTHGRQCATVTRRKAGRLPVSGPKQRLLRRRRPRRRCRLRLWQRRRRKPPLLLLVLRQRRSGRRHRPLLELWWSLRRLSPRRRRSRTRSSGREGVQGAEECVVDTRGTAAYRRQAASLVEAWWKRRPSCDTLLEHLHRDGGTEGVVSPG